MCKYKLNVSEQIFHVQQISKQFSVVIQENANAVGNVLSALLIALLISALTALAATTTATTGPTIDPMIIRTMVMIPDTRAPMFQFLEVWAARSQENYRFSEVVFDAKSSLELYV